MWMNCREARPLWLKWNEKGKIERGKGEAIKVVSQTLMDICIT